MKRSELIHQIKAKQSMLCVGLDTDLDKIPEHLKRLEDPIFAFNKEIIDHTLDHAVAYKLNLAFYERHGVKGWESLVKTVNYLPNDVFKIADAKRGDIGNTADMYAKAFFDQMNFDSITLSPYMGRDSIEPFLNYADKWAIVLGLTSNNGSADIQLKKMEGGSRHVYEEVIEVVSSWGNSENIMFVVGATRGESIQHIREMLPDHFFLVPGVGAQGGSLMEVCKYGLNRDAGLLINSSRGIIYSGSGIDFTVKAELSARSLRNEMKDLLTSMAITKSYFEGN